MWHVSSRSGVATLRTAIHLLLTYLLPKTLGSLVFRALWESLHSVIVIIIFRLLIMLIQNVSLSTVIDALQPLMQICHCCGHL